MKHAHYLSARVLSNPHDLQKNSLALKALLCCGTPKNNISVLEQRGEEISQPILLISFLKKESEINHLFKFLCLKMDSKDKEIVFTEAEKYVDDHLDFFLRFERETWNLEKKLHLTNQGDCFHLTFSLAAYPKRKDAAIGLVRQIFKTR